MSLKRYVLIAAIAGLASASTCSATAGSGGTRRLTDDQCLTQANQIKREVEDFVRQGRSLVPQLEQRALQIAQILQRSLQAQRGRRAQVESLEGRLRELSSRTRNASTATQRHTLSAQQERIVGSIHQIHFHILQNFMHLPAIQRLHMQCTPVTRLHITPDVTFNCINPNSSERIRIDLSSNDGASVRVTTITGTGQLEVGGSARVERMGSTLGVNQDLSFVRTLTPPVMYETYDLNPSESRDNLRSALLRLERDCSFDIGPDGTITIRPPQSGTTTTSPKPTPATESAAP